MGKFVEFHTFFKMGMDNVFPGIVFNPEVHGSVDREKPEFNISWNQEVILVQHDFSLLELDRVQKIIGQAAAYPGKEKEFIIGEYRKILENNYK